MRSNYITYANHFEILLGGLVASGYAVDRKELQADLPIRYPKVVSAVLNQWHARDFLIDRGVFRDKNHYRKTISRIKERAAAESNSGIFGDFSSLHDTVETVHSAGGLILLAHVSQYFPGNERRQISLIRGLIDQGIDGFELYHPLNLAETHFASLAQEADRLSCWISGGSDCHNIMKESSYPLAGVDVPKKIRLITL